MKRHIYIAAPLPGRLKAHRLCRRLEAMGHEVTSTWHRHDSSNVAAELGLRPKERAAISKLCRRELRASNTLVVLYAGNGRSGHLTEFGFFAGMRESGGHSDWLSFAAPLHEGSELPNIFFYDPAVVTLTTRKAFIHAMSAQLRR